MIEFVTAVGLVLVIEGLAYALFPDGMKQALAVLADLSPESLRTTGLVAAAIGVAIVWIARQFLAGS